MKKSRILIFIALSMIFLAACSNKTAPETPKNAPAPAASTASDALSASQLALGMLKLPDDVKISADQAHKLLPLWQAFISLANSDATAQAELDGLTKQIQNELTPEQMQSIQAMKLDDEAIADYFKENGISMRGLMGKAGGGGMPGMPGGGPGGGMPGGMSPGGGPGEVSPEVRATAIAERLGNDPDVIRKFNERALAAAVVTSLQELTGTQATPEPLTLGPRLVERLAAAAGADAAKVQASLDAGATLADAITQNNGDLDAAKAIIAEIYTNIYELSGDALAQKVEEFMQQTQ